MSMPYHKELLRSSVSLCFREFFVFRNKAKGVKPSLEMTVRIANALNATTDQLLAHEFSHPEEIYLKEIAKRIEKYPVSKRRLACEGFNTYLDSLEKFSKT